MAAWLALLLGVFGVHRLYLYGWRDRLMWLYPLPTLLGLLGFMRMRNLGQDDLLGWLLVPLLGVMVSVAMLSAIVCALMPGEKWAARFGPGGGGAENGAVAAGAADAGSAIGIGAVLAAIVALLLGGAAMMATIAFSAQKFFEWELSRPQAQSSRDTVWSATDGSNAANGPSRG